MEFAGKPYKDAEAHILRTNNWMDTHTFPEGVKVQRFCLTLAGEVDYGMSYLGLSLKIGMVYKLSLDSNIQK